MDDNLHTPKLGTFVMKRQSGSGFGRSALLYEDENLWWFSRTMSPYELGMIVGYRRGNMKHHYVLHILTSSGVSWVDDKNIDEIP